MCIQNPSSTTVVGNLIISRTILGPVLKGSSTLLSHADCFSPVWSQSYHCIKNLMLPKMNVSYWLMSVLKQHQPTRMAFEFTIITLIPWSVVLIFLFTILDHRLMKFINPYLHYVKAYWIRSYIWCGFPYVEEISPCAGIYGIVVSRFSCCVLPYCLSFFFAGNNFPRKSLRWTYIVRNHGFTFAYYFRGFVFAFKKNTTISLVYASQWF